MRFRRAHILVLSAVLAMLCGCGRHPRVIPADKFVRIYHDMFLADQWLRDHQDARKRADSTLFFDPVFRRYGYTFEDYDRSVHYYLDKPEQYAKILDRAGERLRKEAERMQAEADALTARDIELDRYRRGYQRKLFPVDSLHWASSPSLWPPQPEPEAEPDSLETPSVVTDSLAPLQARPLNLKMPGELRVGKGLKER